MSFKDNHKKQIWFGPGKSSYVRLNQLYYGMDGIVYTVCNNSMYCILYQYHETASNTLRLYF
jgi:hypothetical protein